MTPKVYRGAKINKHLPKGPKVVPFGGSHFKFYKVIPKGTTLVPLGKPLQSKEQESNTQNLLMANSDATPGQRPRPCYGTAASQGRRELASAAPPSAALWLGSVKKTRRYHPPPPKRGGV